MSRYLLQKCIAAGSVKALVAFVTTSAVQKDDILDTLMEEEGRTLECVKLVAEHADELVDPDGEISLRDVCVASFVSEQLEIGEYLLDVS